MPVPPWAHFARGCGEKGATRAPRTSLSLLRRESGSLVIRHQAARRLCHFGNTGLRLPMPLMTGLCEPDADGALVAGALPGGLQFGAPAPRAPLLVGGRQPQQRCGQAWALPRTDRSIATAASAAAAHLVLVFSARIETTPSSDRDRTAFVFARRLGTTAAIREGVNRERRTVCLKAEHWLSSTGKVAAPIRVHSHQHQRLCPARNDRDKAGRVQSWPLER